MHYYTFWTEFHLIYRHAFLVLVLLLSLVGLDPFAKTDLQHMMALFILPHDRPSTIRWPIGFDGAVSLPVSLAPAVLGLAWRGSAHFCCTKIYIPHSSSMCAAHFG